jgi:integrase
MKSGHEHRIPLNPPALNLLKTLQASDGRESGDFIFPGTRGPLSDMSLTAVLRRMQVAATAHGSRSTFRDWAAEFTSHPNEVAELALAHAVGDKVKAAYRRGHLFDKRVVLMADWARFMVGSAAAARWAFEDGSSVTTRSQHDNQADRGAGWTP